MNQSDLSRKDQVYQYLKTRMNAWVDGPELANEEVGGSEGLKRLRELRSDLKVGGVYEIQMRGHPTPGRDIFQYRLSQRTITPAEAHTEPAPAHPMQVAVGSPPERSPSGPNATAIRRGTHLAFDGERYITVYDGPPIVVEEPEPVAAGQLDLGVPEAELHKFTKYPKGFAMGEAIMCPMCKGIHRVIKEKDPVTGKASKLGKVIGYEEKTRDPRHPSNNCPRCDGWGLIPPT